MFQALRECIMIESCKDKNNIHSYRTDTKIVTNETAFDVFIYLRNSYILSTM
jgi:hypothetical protein